MLNYDELRDHFADQPCLKRMLSAVGSVNFPRACVNVTELGKHHQAKQDAHARILHCSGGASCKVDSMNRIALKATREAGISKLTCTKAETALCERASAHGLRSKGVTEVELCALEAVPSTE